MQSVFHVFTNKNPAKLREFENILRKKIKKSQDNWSAWAGLGKLLQDHFARYDEAENAYRKVLEFATTSRQRVWALANLGMLLHEHLERYEEAETIYRQMIEIDPNNDWAWGVLGKLFHECHNQPVEAEKMYREALTRNTANIEVGKDVADRIEQKSQKTKIEKIE